MGAKPDLKPSNRDEQGRFSKGASGNLAGRPPKNRALTAALESTIDKKLLAVRLYDLALAGDMQAIKYIYDRIEGTPTQRVEFSIEDYVHELREKHPSLDDDAANVIARRAQEFWQRTG